MNTREQKVIKRDTQKEVFKNKELIVKIQVKRNIEQA